MHMHTCDKSCMIKQPRLTVLRSSTRWKQYPVVKEKKKYQAVHDIFTIRAVHLISNRVSLELSFWNTVWSATVRILLSSLFHSKFYKFFVCICKLSGMWTVWLSSVPGEMVSADRGFDIDEMVALMQKSEFPYSQRTTVKCMFRMQTA